MQAIGAALPITWWIEGVRRALLGGASPGRLGGIPTIELVAVLAIGTVAIWAVVPRIFTAAIDRAREKGHLDRNTAS